MGKQKPKIVMSFRLEPDVHRELRRLAFLEGRTIETVTTRAIVAEIAKAKEAR